MAAKCFVRLYGEFRSLGHEASDRVTVHIVRRFHEDAAENNNSNSILQSGVLS
jgi:hypothetical protein